MFLLRIDTYGCTNASSIVIPSQQHMFKVPTVSPPQRTQLGQQPALHNSPNYPSASAPVWLPRQLLLIYNGALHDRKRRERAQTFPRTHTMKSSNSGSPALLTCVSVLLVAPWRQGGGWFSLRAHHLLPRTHPDHSPLIGKFNQQAITGG